MTYNENLNPQWEYTVTSDTSVKNLNKLGAEGWELSGNETRENLPILKRKKIINKERDDYYY